MDRLFLVRALTDDQLKARLKSLVAQERRSLADILACIAEVKRRNSYADSGFPHVFAYCVNELKYSEGAAARRINAADAAEKYPEVYSYIEDGLISLSVISRVAPFLTPKNRLELLERVQGKSRRDVERVIAEFAPKPDIADTIRRVPAPMPSHGDNGLAELPFAGQRAQSLLPEAAPAALGEVPANPSFSQRERTRQLSPERVQFSFTASERFRMDFERARQLLRRKFPAGKLEEVFHAIVLAFLDREDPYRRMQKKRRVMRRLSDRAAVERKVPQAIRDQVWLRDRGSCTFVSPEGRRCGAQEFLEYDHVRPWALGGRSDDAENIRLLCRTHNKLAARKIFGDVSSRFADPA